MNRYRIINVELPIGYNKRDLYRATCSILGCRMSELVSAEVVKRSVDAREKPRYVVSVDITLKHVLSKKNKNVRKIPLENEIDLTLITKPHKRPVVVGTGPAGLMAAFVLAKRGLAPIIIERGEDSSSRNKSVTKFWKHGTLNTESNVLYGEGGAGLFSDGKLTSRSKDNSRVKFFLKTLVELGADKSILIDSDSHIGTDRLLEIIPAIRKKIESMGGEFFFNTKFDNIIIRNGSVCSVLTNKFKIDAENIILATGHSARDIYTMLHSTGVALSNKNFAVGVRVEIPQKIVNTVQWGKWHDVMRFKPASFRLTRKENEYSKACYSFCMCPGGVVIPCASEAGLMTINGMSYSQRNGLWANAAFLIPVAVDEYSLLSDAKDPLSGLRFQETIEQKVFVAGGSDYSIPAESLNDFLVKSKTPYLPEKRSFKRVVPYDINSVLPEFIAESLRRTIPEMIKPFNAISFDEVTVYGAETRSSSPLRIIRDKNGESTSTRGLFPCGEGAGYAGGIVSSAIDGIKVAEALCERVGG